MANEKRLIDANAFFDIVRFADADMHEVDTNENHTYGFTREAIKDMLDDAPTVDAVEVVHGRWEAYKPESRGYAFGFTCSNCGVTTYLDYAQKVCDYNYCPNCGAKMDGDGND